MKRSIAVLALAACVVLASAADPAHFKHKHYKNGHAYGYGDTMPYQGGYECKGKITSVTCYTDHKGIVTGLRYENDYDGASHAVCDVSGPPSDELVLDPLESIIKVEACRGGRYGYTRITFTTDAGVIWTCGGADYGYQPGGYEGYWSDYQRYSWKRSGRGLLQSEAAAGEATAVEAAAGEASTDPDTFYKKHHGWGWNSECMVYESPRQADWSQCGGCSDWYANGYNSEKFGMAATSYKSKYAGYSAYYKHADKAGKYSHYYKDYATYQQQNSQCGQSACDYTPDYYYKQLYPLAAFSGLCDKHGNIYNLWGFCWNSHYVGPQPADAIPVRVIAELDASLTCDIFQSQEQLVQLFYAQMALFQATLVAANPALEGMSIVVVNSSIACNPPVAGALNSTITAGQVFLVAPEGVPLEDFAAELAKVLPDQNANVCVELPGSCPEQITSLQILGAAKSVKKIRSRMANRRVRTQRNRATPVPRRVPTFRLPRP